MKEKSSSHQKFLQTTFQKTPHIYALTGPNYIWRKFTVCVDVLTLQNHNENPFGSVFPCGPFSIIVYGALNHNRVPHIFAAENHMEEEQIQRYEYWMLKKNLEGA